jgi:NADP-dependent 3-hydroxy acid dehydrogenase YdfG
MLSRNIVLITGAGGAIGSVVAQRFDEANWSLALLDYAEDSIQALKEQFPNAFVASADLTDEASARDAVAAVEDEVGPIGAVLNIAGGFAMQPAAEATDDDRATMHQLNFVTLFNTTRAALPHMQERREGLVLGVSAAAAIDGAPQAALYAASKAGVAAYLKSLHAELRDEGIRTAVVYPMGVVDTPANREAMPDSDPEMWIEPGEIADHMLHVATRSSQGHVRELQIFAPSITA